MCYWTKIETRAGERGRGDVRSPDDRDKVMLGVGQRRLLRQLRREVKRRGGRVGFPVWVWSRRKLSDKTLTKLKKQGMVVTDYRNEGMTKGYYRIDVLP